MKKSNPAYRNHDSLLVRILCMVVILGVPTSTTTAFSGPLTSCRISQSTATKSALTVFSHLVPYCFVREEGRHGITTKHHPRLRTIPTRLEAFPATSRLEEEEEEGIPDLSVTSPPTNVENNNAIASRTSVQKRNLDIVGEDDDTPWNTQNLRIAVPALMGFMADPFLSMVDTGFVGRMGVIDLGALGVCTSVFHMCFSIFRGSTVATISLMNSATTDAEEHHIARISLQLAGVLGTIVFLGLRFLGAGTWLLSTMGVTPDSPLFHPACRYLFARAWAAPAVVGIVVAEGIFRGNDDTRTPLIASSVAAILNLILDPIMMFPMKMGMMGAAAATAISQFGAGGIYALRLQQKKLLSQSGKNTVLPKGNTGRIVRKILGANLSMLAKQGSLLTFYTVATGIATRMGPIHIATHQIAYGLFCLTTLWLDTGNMSAQMIMGRNLKNREKALSLSKYFVKYSMIQGLAIMAIVAGVGRFVPSVFTQDVGIQRLLLRCVPHLAFQQLLVSVVLVLEGLALGGNQFRYMAAGTAVSTVVGVYQLSRATDVVGIWSSAVNTFFGFRLVNAIIGVTRIHLSLKAKERFNGEDDATMLPVPG